MKWICYAINNPVNKGTAEAPLWEDQLLGLKVPDSQAALAIVRETAYNGQYSFEDDGNTDATETPTRLDAMEAQMIYTAMMTDTLLEV